MAGSFIDNSKSKNSDFGLKFGIVGNYKSYFRNVKRKGKVIFDHSTTLRQRWVGNKPIAISKNDERKLGDLERNMV